MAMTQTVGIHESELSPQSIRKHVTSTRCWRNELYHPTLQSSFLDLVRDYIFMKCNYLPHFSMLLWLSVSHSKMFYLEYLRMNVNLPNTFSFQKSPTDLLRMKLPVHRILNSSITIFFPLFPLSLPLFIIIHFHFLIPSLKYTIMAKTWLVHSSHSPNCDLRDEYGLRNTNVMPVIL